MNGYITAQEAAKKWGVTSRQVQILCKENRVPGASRMSRIWIIPGDAQKSQPALDIPRKGERTDGSYEVNSILTFLLLLGQCMNSFAGSGLVGYGLQGMFAPIWANDISEQKAAVYTANFGKEHFLLDDIKNINGADIPYANMSWASFPCQDLSLSGIFRRNSRIT